MDGMGGNATAGHDHAGHDHAAHDHASHEAGMGGMDMGKMGGVERLPDGGYHYPHGGFDGHVVPGAFFLVRPRLVAWCARAHGVGAVCCSCTAAAQPGRRPLWTDGECTRRQRLCVLAGRFTWHVASNRVAAPPGALPPLPPPPTHKLSRPAPRPPPQVWGFWWTLTTFATYVQCLAARRGFRTRAWRPLPWGSPRLRSLPLEPLVKIVLPAFGILGELWLGHESWRRVWTLPGRRWPWKGWAAPLPGVPGQPRALAAPLGNPAPRRVPPPTLGRNLYAADGKFTDNINDWQHSTMYLSFMASGVVDLLGHYLGAPRGAELVSTGVAWAEVAWVAGG